MPLPPNLTQAQFDAAMEKYASVVGSKWAFTDDEKLSAYADPFSPKIGNGQPLPSGVVAPKQVEEVQEVVRISNEFKIPLWVVSTGKNFGYGGCEAIVPGSVILDLKRMNQILEVNEDLAYAVVEPGVAQYDLWKHCEDKGISVWIDGPSPAWSSVIANTIERGAGYGPKGNRYDQACGMEVVLPNGELLRTGMGALEDAPTWHTYKYGFGPIVDGLFSQSNLGIVTKLGIFVNPQPEAYRSIAIDVPKYSQVVDLINTLRPLRIGGVVRSAASIVPKPPEGAPEPDVSGRGGGEHAPDPEELYAKLETHLGWRLRIGVAGYKEQVEVDWRKIYRTFKDAIPGVKIGSDLYEAPYDYEKMDTLGKLHAAVPSMQETEIWRHGAVFISTMIPCVGEEFWKQIEVMRKVYGEFHQPYIGSFLHFHSERSIMTLLGAPIIPGDTEQNERAIALGKRIIEVAAENGWGEYRTPTTFMQAASDVYSFNDHALRRFTEVIKDAIDPNGILAPGKNGIWPASMRSGK